MKLVTTVLFCEFENFQENLKILAHVHMSSFAWIATEGLDTLITMNDISVGLEELLKYISNSSVTASFLFLQVT